MPDGLNIGQFAGYLRESSPGSYEDIADDVLVKMFISSYPEYQDLLLEDTASKLTRERVQLNPIQEEQFQEFWKGDPSVQNWKNELGDPNKSPDDYRDKFDYRKAWYSGDKPQYIEEYGEYHWGSEGKDKDHPTYLAQFGIDEPRFTPKTAIEEAVDLGYRPSAGAIMANQADMMWKETVSGMVGMASTAVQDILSGSGTDAGKDWGTAVTNWAEDWRKDVDEYTHKKIQEDPTLLAYYQWKKDEPLSTDNWWHLDIIKRGASEALPSLGLAVAGTAIGTGLSVFTGASSLSITAASLAPMFMAEAGSEYNEAMRILVDEKGLDPEEANDYAAVLAASYGTVSSVLERAGIRHIMKGIPGLKNVVGKDVKKQVMSKMADDIVQKGLGKNALAQGGLRLIGGATQTMSGILGEGGTEYLQAFAQNSINYGLREGWGKNPDEVLKVMGEAVAHASLAGETFEEAYAGGVMGAAFGGVSGLSTGLQEVAAKSAEEWNESKVVELKQELRGRGLKVSGNKDALVKRLMDDDIERYNLEEPSVEDSEPPVAPEPEVKVESKPPVDEKPSVEPAKETPKESKDLLSAHISNLVDPTNAPPTLPADTDLEKDEVAETIVRSKRLRSQGLRILDLVKRHPETLKKLASLPKEQKAQIYGYVIEEMKAQFPNSKINETNIEKLLEIYSTKGTLIQKKKKDTVLEEERAQVNVKFDKKLNKKEAAILKRLGVPDDVISKVEKKLKKQQERKIPVKKAPAKKTATKPKVATKPKPQTVKGIQAKIDKLTEQYITGKPKDDTNRIKAEKTVEQLEAQLQGKPPKKEKLPVEKKRKEPTQAQLEKKLEDKIKKKKPLPPEPISSKKLTAKQKKELAIYYAGGGKITSAIKKKVEASTIEEYNAIVGETVEENLQQRMTRRLAEVANKTAEKWVSKEQVKTKIATQFIGAGKKGSSTDKYRGIYQEEGVANTGEYKSDDIIYVSSNGKRAGRVNPVKDGVLQGVYKNIDKAIEAGATIVMDTRAHLRKTRGYNIGEVALATYLSKHGYIDNNEGIWKPDPLKKPLPKFEESASIAVLKDKIQLGKVKGKWKARIDGKEVALTKRETEQAKHLEKEAEGRVGDSMMYIVSATELLKTDIYQRVVIDAKKKAEASVKKATESVSKKPTKSKRPRHKRKFQKTSPLPTIREAQASAEKIISRLRKTYPFVKAKGLAKVLHENGSEVLGSAIDTAVEWSTTKGKLDTPPHEFAHVYISLLMDDPIVKKMMQVFGGEENLVQYMGEYYANRVLDTKLKKKLSIWLKKFWAKVKQAFRGTDALSEAQQLLLLTEGFYAGVTPTTGRSLRAIHTSPNLASEYKYQGDTTNDLLDENEVSASENATSGNINFLNSYFVNVLGHIKTAQWMEIQRVGVKKDNFDDYFKWFKKFAIKIDTKNANREYTIAEVNSLRLLWQKLNNRIKIYDEQEDSKPANKLQSRYRNRIQIFFQRFWDKREGVTYGDPELSYVHSGRNEPDDRSIPAYDMMNFIEEQQDGDDRVRTLHIRQEDIASWQHNKNYDAAEAQRAFEEGFDYGERPKWFKRMGISFGTWINHIDGIFRGDAVAGDDLMFFAGAKAGDNKGILIGVVPNSIREKVVDEASFIEHMEQDLEKIAKDEGFEGDVEQLKKDVLKEMLKMGRNRGNTAEAWAQVAGYHEWWKGVRFDGYLLPDADGNYPTVLDLWKRLNIDFHNGMVPRGTGESKIMLFNADDPSFSVEMNGEKVEHRFKNRYAFDGWLMTSGRRMKKIAIAIGRTATSDKVNQMNELKSFIRHKDGNDYVGLKHLEMEPVKGMVFKMGGEVIAEVKLGRDQKTYFVDKHGNEFDMLASNEEAKVTNGKFKENGVIHTLPENATKITYITSEKSKSHAAFPFQQGQLMSDDSLLESNEFSEGLKAITKHIVATARQWLVGDTYPDGNKRNIGLFDMRKDSEALWDMIYSPAGSNDIQSHQQQILDLIGKDGMGVHHPEIIQPLLQYIFNKFIRNGIYKGRQRDKNNSTYVYLKPKAHLGIDKDSFIIGRKNNVIWNKVKENYITWAHEQSTDENLTRQDVGNAFDNKSKAERLTILNDFLSTNPMHFQISRQPIAKVTGVRMYKLQEIAELPSSEAVYMNPEDVFETLDGDHDGDKVAVEYFDDDSVRNPLIKLSKSKAFRDADKIVDLDIFEKGAQFSIFSSEGVEESLKNSARTEGSQGAVTNAKSISSLLAFKKLAIKTSDLISGWIVPRKSGDVFIVRDMPLDRDVLFTEKEKGKTYYDFIIQNGDEVVLQYKDDKGNMKTTRATKEDIVSGVDGTLLLKTNFGHFTSILLQAAVDDAKYGLLSKMQYDGFPWLAQRMFKREDGQALSKMHIWGAINPIYKYFNFSTIRWGALRGDRETLQTMHDAFRIANEVKNFEQHIDDNKRRAQLGEGKKLDPKGKESIVEIHIESNKITPIEAMLIEMADLQEAFTDGIIADTEESGKLTYESILEWHEDFIRAVHQKAITQMSAIWNDVNASPKAEEDGILFIRGISNEYFGILKKLKVAKNDPNLYVNYDRTQVFQDFVDKHIDDWKALTPNAKIYATLFWLRRGGDAREGKNQGINLRFLPIAMMEKRTLKQYLNRFEMLLQSPIDVPDARHNQKFVSDTNIVFGFSKANARIKAKIDKKLCGGT